MTTTTTATDNPDTERELAVLRVDHENDTAPQRDIARTTGMSLGMTNAVRGRLSQKGLLTIRRVKGRHMRYAAARDGYHTVVLAGESDLAFHVEHACIHEGLTFVREPKQDKQNNNKVDVSSHAPERPHGAFRLIGEAAPAQDAETTGGAWLWDVITGISPKPDSRTRPRHSCRNIS